MRLPRRADETGSLALAQLLTLVGVSLTALLIPLMLTQVRATREDIARVHGLHAAQTGIDVAFAHIRAARDASGNGVVASLPCGPYSGNVGVGGTANYQVTIDYFAVDPQGGSAAWIAANRLPCTPGTGPTGTPAFALLRAVGTDKPPGSAAVVPSRSVQATYPFQHTNRNNVGGLVHAYAAAGMDLCLDAGSAAPTAGTNVQLRPCSPGSGAQRFAYEANLNLVLAASRTQAQPLGMCLDAGSTPHAAARVVQLQPCATTTRPQQQWPYNGTGNFEGTADGTTPDGFCFNVQTPNTSGSFVVLGSVAASTCRLGPDSVQTFQPEAAVGTGAAGAAAGQLVHLGRFARCVDVTGQDVITGYLTAWPCTQAVNVANVGWDQKWTLPAIATGATSATGRVTTVAPGGTYCMRSPGSTAAGQYVKVTICPTGTTPTNLTWTVSVDTGTFATSYRIVDGYGYCLGVTDPNASPADLHPTGQKISKLVVAACSGAAAQKWNAPPNALQAVPLTDVVEK